MYKSALLAPLLASLLPSLTLQDAAYNKCHALAKWQAEVAKYLAVGVILRCLLLINSWLISRKGTSGAGGVLFASRNDDNGS